MSRKLILYMIIMILVPLAGELKFFPFEGYMRVSLGTPVFFFFLLWTKEINAIIVGALVGSSVVIFRIFLSMINTDAFLWNDGFSLHFPVFFYYFIYACLFHLFKVNTLYQKPFFIGLLGVVIEIAASVTEIAFRSLFTHNPLTLEGLTVIGAIAIFRSFFVLGFFNILILRETRLEEEVLRKRNEKMLMLISNLYIEMIQLSKSMKNAEEVTRACYNLYRRLSNESEQNPYASDVLSIAGRIHELKKDQQRIHAGLSKLMPKENIIDFMTMEEIIEIVVTSNNQYGQTTDKAIEYEINIQVNHPQYHTFMLLSIINNLVSNAVEACQSTGTIAIIIVEKKESLFIQVSDDGPGISAKHKDLIFEPGFTTKFNDAGIASNGIGLTYVKDFIDNLGGQIQLSNDDDKWNTTFTIELPIKRLTKGA